MKSVFKYRRTAEEFDKWVNIVAPKKNLKKVNKEENKNKEKNITDNVNMTKIEDYIVQQFSEVKKDINDIEKFLNNSNNKTNGVFKNEKEDFYDDDDENIIEIKITPFLISEYVVFYFLLKIAFFYLKKCIFKTNSLPKDMHQKN